VLVPLVLVLLVLVLVGATGAAAVLLHTDLE
jgi:hypothetical protein